MLFLREEVVVVMDGLGLITEVLLAGFYPGDLVVRQVKLEPKAFKAGGGHDLAVFVHVFTTGGDLVLLLRTQQGLEFGLLIPFERDQAGLVLLQRDIILFVQFFAFLPVVFVDGHDLLPLFGGIMNKFAVTAAEAVLAEAVLTEAVLMRTMENIAVGGAIETVEGRIVGCAVETMMCYMGGVGGLSVGRTTKDEYSQDEEQCFSIHDFTFYVPLR